MEAGCCGVAGPGPSSALDKGRAVRQALVKHSRGRAASAAGGWAGVRGETPEKAMRV
jgi:hypothetical protein